MIYKHMLAVSLNLDTTHTNIGNFLSNRVLRRDCPLGGIVRKSGHFLLKFVVVVFVSYVPTGIWSCYLKSDSLILHTSEILIRLIDLHGLHH